MQLDAARTREAELLTTISTLQDTISTQGVSAAMGKAEANLVQLRKENEQYRANRHNTDQRSVISNGHSKRHFTGRPWSLHRPPGHGVISSRHPTSFSR